MSSNIRTIVVNRDENNQISIQEVMEDDIPPNMFNSDDVFLHPVLIAMSHSLILGSDFDIDMNSPEEKHKLSIDEFKNLEICTEITNCAICMENKKSNIKLKCQHIFCNNCILLLNCKFYNYSTRLFKKL